MQWAVINAQLEESQPVIRQFGADIGELGIRRQQSPPHVSHCRPVSQRKMREEAHDLGDLRTADGPE